LPAVKRTELKVFSTGENIAKNRAKQPGTLPFATISTGLKPILEHFCFVKLPSLKAALPNSVAEPLNRMSCGIIIHQSMMNVTKQHQIRKFCFQLL
jgi:hypothetical protein